MLWTEEEVNTLRTYYPSEGCETVKRLPGRTLSCMFSKVYRLGLKCGKPSIIGPEWTKDELFILLTKYESEGSEGCAELIKTRTAAACKHKASQYGLVYSAYKNRQRPHLPGPYRTRWKVHEFKILREFYPTLGSSVCAYLPGRTANACQCMAIKLRVRYVGEKVGV